MQEKETMACRGYWSNQLCYNHSMKKLLYDKHRQERVERDT